MKTSSLIVLAGVSFMASCGNGNNGTKTEDSVSNKEGQAMVTQPDTTLKTATVAVDQKTADFAIAAANAGMKEIELAKWEQEYGTRQDAKDFAGMMITDHTNAANELKRIASTKSLTLPNLVPDSERENMDKMKTKKQGKEVDKAYVNEMVDDHRKAVKLFEDAAKDVTDMDLKNFASQTLPVLQKHFDHIKAIKAKM
ncbi:DUF4142 domain-containing protein [Sediminibacterium soli]|uniref:DUF4142 domain-containing protein n=1 Tax=Sediminibacterium soli TaxID=2698829 RepID=UPI00137AE3CC|nr:DUF4142 domain-containing protein [Sediminibacterium soli]NCI45642.1 DUF4142 domain-containing protein [Sediminibacterium soli]